MVQIQTEIAKKLAAQEVTKMISQPTNLGIDLLEQELTVIAAGICSPQGNSGHAGILWRMLMTWRHLRWRYHSQLRLIPAFTLLDLFQMEQGRNVRLDTGGAGAGDVVHILLVPQYLRLVLVLGG